MSRNYDGIIKRKGSRPKIAAPVFKRFTETADIFYSTVDQPHDEHWEGLREKMLELVRVVCRDAPAARIKREAVQYAIAIRAALALVQNFQCREISELEERRISNRLTVKATYEALNAVADAMERDQFFIAYEKLDGLVRSALKWGAP